jgi:nitroreductase/polysaccharide pyruvyl transferase WcaK-like protein
MDTFQNQISNEDYKRLISIIKSRRSCRRFKDIPVDRALLEKLIEAAIWAPTGCNQQEVRFVLVTKKEDLEVLLQAKKAVNPQAAILIYTDTNATYYKGNWDDPHKSRLQYLNAGAAAMNILLTAESLGLGALWVNLSPYWQGAHGENVTELYKRFDLPNTLKLQSAIYIGYPESKPDLGTAKWHGKPIMRAPVSEYIITVPRKTAILHYQSPNHYNLGSRALSEGLLNLARELLGETHWLRIFTEYPVSSLLTKQYLGDDPEQAISRFEALAEATVRRLKHAHEIPEDSFPRYFWRSRAKLFLGQRGFQLLTKLVPKKKVNPYDIYSVRKEIGNLKEPAAKELSNLTVDDIPSLIIEPERTFAEKVLGKLLPRIWGMRHIEKRLFELARFDTVIYNGNGYLADQYGDALVRRLFELYAATKLCKEVIACNLSVDLEDEILKLLTVKVFRELKKIVVREPASKEKLLSYGLPEESIVVGADAAIFASIRDFDDISDTFGQNINPSQSIALILRGDTGHNVEKWADVVRALKNKADMEIVLLSSCLKQDISIMRPIAEQTGAACMVRMPDHPQFINLLSKFHLVISERYHPCVFCIRTQTPVIPMIGNTIKTQGLFSLFPYSIPVINPDMSNPLNVEALCQAVSYALENAETLRAELANGYQTLKNKAKENVLPCLS